MNDRTTFEAPGSTWHMLFYKEVLRFWRVSFQTVAAPVIMALLYLLIFSHVLESRVSVFGGSVSYTAFLVPGLVMMTVLQNAFANTSSSLIQSKITGNMIFFLLAPITPWGFFLAYVLAAVLRGTVVGIGVWLVAALFFAPELWRPAAPLWAIAFGFLGGAILAMLGMIAGLWSEKFDQLATFQNFIILPLTFLSGVFYSVHSLPAFWFGVSHLNPFFYVIDGFRYGFFGVSDVSPWLSLTFVGTVGAVLTWGTWALIARGWKLRI
ncbi:MAG: ABC transporter permease [Burkholderiales bacterium]|jgi:ABC-2 type transport system permease protein|nr:ABC transporter permease [Burkholderiales bacterium]